MMEDKMIERGCAADHLKPAIFDRLASATWQLVGDCLIARRGRRPLGAAVFPRSRVGDWMLLAVGCSGRRMRLTGTQQKRSVRRPRDEDVRHAHATW